MWTYTLPKDTEIKKGKVIKMSDVKLKYDKFDICQTVAMKYGRCVVDDTLIVPDIKSDIKKILCVSARVYITNTTPSQDKVHIEGTVKAAVLYQPDGDVTGCVKTLELSREFSHALEIKGTEPDSIVSAEAEIDTADATLINSRKVNVRISVELGVKVGKAEPIEVPIGVDENDAPDIPKKPDFLDILPFKARGGQEDESNTQKHDKSQENIQFRSVPIRIAGNRVNTDGSIIIREQYEVPSKLCEVGEILMTNVNVEPEEAVTSEGNTRVRGNLKINIMYEDKPLEQDGNEKKSSIKTAELTAEFSEQFDTPGTFDDMECEAEYTVREVYTEVRDNADGEAKIIGVEVVLGVVINEYSINEPMVVTDAYALGSDDLKMEFEEIAPEQISDMKATEITVKSTAKRNANTQPEIMGVCCVDVTRISVDDIKIEDNTAIVKGSIDCKIVYISNDENQPMSYIDHKTDFENRFECEGLSGSKIACDAKVFVNNIGYTISGSDAVDLRFIIDISLKMVKNERVKLIKTIERCEGSDNTNNGMNNYVIYFVQCGDTLWNIAKRYRTTVDAIVSNNNIPDPDKIFPGQKIKITV